MYYRLQNEEYKKGEALIALVAEIPLTVTDLDLTNIGLYNLDGEELLAFIRAIPITVTSLNLSENSLCKRTGDELVACIAALPPLLRSLNLSNNWLNHKTNDELIAIVAKIPPSVRSLNLSNNNLGFKMLKDLKAVINAIPPTVISLDLSASWLDKMKGTALGELLGSLPATLRSLNLSQNRLHKVPAEFAAAVAMLPATLNALDLSGNDFKDEHIQAIMFEIPFTVELISLYPLKVNNELFIQTVKPITINEYYAKKLVDDVADLIAQQGADRFAFDTIETDLLITGTCLNRLVEILEKHNLPIAELTCGLLVEGQIEPRIEVLSDCNEYDQHIERRTHDAISFYTKAARDLDLKPIVEYLLRNIKMTCASTSVQNRLAFYDLSSKGRDTQNCLVTPLLASFGVFTPVLPESDECRVITTCRF